MFGFALLPLAAADEAPAPHGEALDMRLFAGSGLGEFQLLEQATRAAPPHRLEDWLVRYRSDGDELFFPQLRSWSRRIDALGMRLPYAGEAQADAESSIRIDTRPGTLGLNIRTAVQLDALSWKLAAVNKDAPWPVRFIVDLQVRGPFAGELWDGRAWRPFSLQNRSVRLTLRARQDADGHLADLHIHRLQARAAADQRIPISVASESGTISGEASHIAVQWDGAMQVQWVRSNGAGSWRLENDSGAYSLAYQRHLHAQMEGSRLSAVLAGAVELAGADLGLLAERCEWLMQLDERERWQIERLHAESASATALRWRVRQPPRVWIWGRAGALDLEVAEMGDWQLAISAVEETFALVVDDDERYPVVARNGRLLVNGLRRDDQWQLRTVDLHSAPDAALLETAVISDRFAYTPLITAESWHAAFAEDGSPALLRSGRQGTYRHIGAQQREALLDLYRQQQAWAEAVPIEPHAP